MDIQIGGKLHHKDWLLTTATGQTLLQQSKDNKVRPRCACKPGGIEMYVAARGTLHYLARMPGTSDQHSETCQSHMVPSSLYSSDTPASILVSLLRNTNDIRRSKWVDLRTTVLKNAQCMVVDGVQFIDRIFVPDFFNKDQTAAQRNSLEKFVDDGESEDATHRRWLLAPVKDVVPTKYGAKVTIKHLPSIKFWAGREPAFKLLSDTDSAFALGLFEVKKSKSGIFIADCALHVVKEQSELPLPDSQSFIEKRSPEVNSDKLLAVCKKMNLPLSTPRRLIVDLLIEKFLAEK